MTVQCCCCGSIRTEAHAWEAPTSSPVQVSHSYCPACAQPERARVLAELAYYRSAAVAAA